MLERLKHILTTPLLTLSGTAVTLASLLTALGIVVVSRVVASIAARGAQQLLKRRGLSDAAQFAVGKIVRYVVFLLGLVVAIGTLGVRVDAILAASAALLVGIGFGLQSIAQNFVSGLILLLERHVGKGDFVQIGKAYGSVVDIGLRATTVVTRDEVTIIVPNSELVNAQVINHSVPSTNLRVWITVGVAYGSDVRLVERTLLAVAAAEPQVLRDPPPEVRFDDFGESALRFSLLVWIANPGDDLRISSKIRFAIEAAFRQAGITLPFPQLDVHLKSGGSQTT